MMPQYDNKITLGNIGIIVTLVATLIGAGAAWGNADSRLVTVERQLLQMAEDSRTLIRLQSDVDYIKQAVDDLRNR